MRVSAPRSPASFSSARASASSIWPRASAVTSRGVPGAKTTDAVTVSASGEGKNWKPTRPVTIRPMQIMKAAMASDTVV